MPLAVLLVEDDPADVRLVERMFATEPVTLSVAPTLAAAFALAAAEPPDAVLLDLALPDSQGLETVEAVRRELPSVPIVVITGHDDRDLALRALHAGAQDYLVKGRIWPELLDRSVRYSIERKRREAENARLARAVEQANDAVLITDAAGAIEYVNPAFERMTGFTRAEIVGKTPLAFDGDPCPERNYRDILAAVARGESWTGVLVTRRKDGSTFEEESIISPLRDASGEIVNHVTIKRDLTRERRFEERLRQAQKMEAVGQLAGGIAHDFNNILMAILGASEVLGGVIEPGAPGYSELAAIRRAGERAAQLTRRLLAFARRQVLDRADFDLVALLDEMAPIFERLVPAGIRLEVDAPRERCVVHGDREQLSQVLLNLVVNARDAMPDGGTLRVALDLATIDDAFRAAHAWARPGRYVRLVVEDTGVGIDPDTLARIFEPFFTTKERGKGTGMGLAICYGIVKQHRGVIDLTSEPGRGTTASVYLPAVARAAAAVAVPAPDVALSPGHGECVLVVEDEAEVRRIVHDALSEFGYRVLAADNGEGALDILRHHGPAVDLVLTDIVMPRMGGRELYRNARALGCNARFLFSSGYPESAIDDTFLKREGVQFIAKPYGIAALAAKVKAALGSAATS